MGSCVDIVGARTAIHHRLYHSTTRAHSYLVLMASLCGLLRAHRKGLWGALAGSNVELPRATRTFFKWSSPDPHARTVCVRFNVSSALTQGASSHIYSVAAHMIVVPSGAHGTRTVMLTWSGLLLQHNLHWLAEPLMVFGGRLLCRF